MRCIREKELNRRGFLRAGLVGSTALAVSTLPTAVRAAVTKPEGDPLHGLKFGMASYSFQKFTLDQAIDKTKQAGLKYINLKDFHLPLKSTTAERQATCEKIKAAGLTLMGGGVIYMKNDPADIRAAFVYAKEAGMPTIVCSPEPEALDTVEKMAVEFDIRIAIHNHGPTDQKYPSPRDVLKLVKNRDQHMGICMDVGHTVRIGEDPVAVIHDCARRLYDFHLKDETLPTKEGKPIQVGRGIIDIVGVLKALIKIKFPGHLGLEYEANPKDPLPGVLESVGYVRGVLAAI